MSPESFCYWLKGWFELNDAHGFDRFEPSIECVDTIKAHLDLVFVNVTKPAIPVQTEKSSPFITGQIDYNFPKHKEETLYC